MVFVSNQLSLYTLYTQTGHGDSLAERDMGSEYARQREHMERSVASLRKKLAKDTAIHRKDNIRVMQVNTLTHYIYIYIYIQWNLR